MITFWKNGFSIDDGPLMDYESHKNVLENLEKGENKFFFFFFCLFI